MSILRFSTLSLTLAIAIFSLGYVDSASVAAPRPCPDGDLSNRCKPKPGDEPNGLTYTVDLVGPNLGDADIRGAFEFDDAGMPSGKPATLNKGSLSGPAEISMTRPGPGASVADAETVWNDVFNLCGLLGPFNEEGVPNADDGWGPTLVDYFTVEGGDWSVSKGGGKIWLSLEFALDSPLDADDPLFTDRLSASMQLTRPCENAESDPSCINTPLIPAAGSTTNKLTNARIHLRGKGGVTHEAVCHADDDALSGDGLSDTDSFLVITAVAPE